MRPTLTCAVAIATTGIYGGAAAQQSDLDALFYGTQNPATEYKAQDRLAPAVVTTIERAEIEALGATTLDEVFARVPGVVVQKNRVGDPIYVIRSIYNELNPQVMILVDGVQISDPVSGGRPIAWLPPVTNIEKIQIVRGPGSAVFGADALSGVINVVTKTATRKNINEASAYGASFGTVGGHLIKSGSIGAVQYSGAIEGYTTNGNNRLVQRDAQSFLDALTGSSASLAPGPINEDESHIGTRLNIQIGDAFEAAAWFQSFFNNGQGFGPNFILDPVGNRTAHSGGVSLKYETSIGETLIDLRALSNVNRVNLTTLFAPTGAAAAQPPGFFPHHGLNEFSYFTTDSRFDVAAVRQFDQHTIRLGVGVAHQRAFSIEERRNFFVTPLGLAPLPSADLVDVETLGLPKTADPVNRTIAHVLIQDEWRVTPSLSLTAGARFDHFSDVGGTVNPRMSVVWTPAFETTIKVGYGAAFRQPTFTERYANQNGIVAAGNPDLEPETIDTLEISLQHAFASNFEAKIAAYRFWTDNTIEIIDPLIGSPTFINGEGLRGYGIETEFSASFGDRINVEANYAYQDAERRDLGTEAANIPNHIAFVDVGMEVTSSVRAHAIVNYVGERSRSFIDPRPPLDGYVRADLTFQYRPQALSNVRFDFAVTNIFDEEINDPTADGVLAPGDFPRDGRAFQGGVNVSF